MERIRTHLNVPSKCSLPKQGALLSNMVRVWKCQFPAERGVYRRGRFTQSKFDQRHICLPEMGDDCNDFWTSYPDLYQPEESECLQVVHLLPGGILVAGVVAATRLW